MNNHLQIIITKINRQRKNYCNKTYTMIKKQWTSTKGESMPRGSLIVLDGADGVGKETQTKLLVKALMTKKIAVEVFHFPRYNKSSFGALLKKALIGEFGDFKSLSPYLASLPFVLDRMSAFNEIYDALLNGSVVICDRYTPSNIAYQAAKFDGKKEQDDFISFLELAEYEELGLPKPALVIYLDVSTEASQKLMKDDKRKKDQHERDILYQEKVRRIYSRLSNERDDWVRIVCSRGKKLMTKEGIHNLILRRVLEHIL